MEFFDDIFAGWSFEIGNEVEKGNFIELLTILDAFDLLKINRITINVTEELFHSIDKTADLCIECFEKGKILVLSGETMLQTEVGKQMVNEVIIFTFEPQLSLISVDTYTDAWMPISCLNEDLQIDSGIINSMSLRNVLVQISQLSFVKKVHPADNEYFHDYMAYQIGFGLFYKRNIENIKGLAEEDYSKVAPFIW